MIKKLFFSIIFIIALIIFVIFTRQSNEKIVVFNDNIEIIDPVEAGGILPVDYTWDRNEDRNLIFNFTNMYQADVIYEENSFYPFKMWFFGWSSDDSNTKFPGCDSIFYARSRDMKKWQIYCGDGKWDTKMDPKKWVPVVYASDNYYDDSNNGDPSVVLKDGKYYMAYSAYGKDKDGIGSWEIEKKDTDGDIACVMGAVSDDGINWTKTSAPLLIWNKEIGVDERIAKKKGNFFGDYHRPSLMWDDGKWKIWFDYWAGPYNAISMGYAENTSDFTNTDSWKVIRADMKPLIKEWPNPDVLKVGSLYYSFADPMVCVKGADAVEAPWTGWASRQIAEAVSRDGINWTVTGWIKPDTDAAANHVPQAFLYKDTIYLWYATQIGGDPYDYRYDNIRYMTKKFN